MVPAKANIHIAMTEATYSTNPRVTKRTMGSDFLSMPALTWKTLIRSFCRKISVRSSPKITNAMARGMPTIMSRLIKLRNMKINCTRISCQFLLATSTPSLITEI